MLEENPHNEIEKKQQDLQLIDIEKLVRTRGNVLMKRMPQFFVNYVKRTLHEDGLNYFIKKFNHLDGIDFITASLDDFGVESEVHGLENVSNEVRYIFSANHPLGGIDGLLFIKEITGKLGVSKAIVNDLLLNVPNLRSLFIGVNHHGRISRENVALMDDLFNSDVQMLLFPAGLVSRRQKGLVRDLKWKPTFIKRAIKHKRDVVPVHVTGRLSKFFYNLANFRTKVGFKANIEMFFLSDEMFQQAGKIIEFTIGKPIPYATFDNRYKVADWAQIVKEHVYILGENPKAEFAYKPVTE